MAMNDVVKSLQEFDLGDLDFDNVGSWPMAVKAIIWVVVFVICLGLGYRLHLSGLQQNLTQIEQKETTLKAEFKDKAGKAANLDAYRKQMEEMEETFGALVRQLPSDTEVPGLLEDITNRGVASGLEFKSIDLQPEQTAEFYVELPIKMTVEGTYHDLGAFVSGIAGLPRIVTLHDFDIEPGKESDGALTLSITAKTYRYKEEDEGGA
ncbi:MAG: type 4a pilus biogenesis protein PilO [Pseudomonadales bacterium]